LKAQEYLQKKINNLKHSITLISKEGSTWVISCEKESDQQAWQQAIVEEMNRKEKALAIDIVKEIDGTETVCITEYENNIWLCGNAIRIYNSTTLEMEKEIKDIDISAFSQEPIALLLIRKIKFHENNAWIATGNLVICIDLTDFKAIGCCKGHKGRVSDLEFFKGGLYSVAYDGEIFLWDMNTFQLKNQFNPEVGKLFYILKVEKSLWISGFSGVVIVKEDENEKKVIGTTHKDSISSMVFCWKTIWAGSFDGSISVYD